METYLIDHFDGEYAFLSNFFEAPVLYRGIRYRNTEAAFQAQKCIESADQIRFADLDPSRAKRLGRKIDLRSDWEQIKIREMYLIVLEKFQQHPDLRQKLMDTGYAYLVEGNYWHDTFWGVCNGAGWNHLGQILMRVREELRQNNTK